MASETCQVVLLTAPSSNQGKTLVTCALAKYLVDSGYKVKLFKVGPDFIDPQLLSLVTDSTIDTLDLWMMGHELCQQQLYHAAQKNDFILIEGVMGLFDGEPNTADLARYFNLPLIAVIDVAAMGQTVNALCHGLKHYQTGLHWLGYIANQVGSERHLKLLQASEQVLTQLAFLPRNVEFQLPRRHLGLIQPPNQTQFLQCLDQVINALSPADWLLDAPLISFQAESQTHLSEQQPLLQSKHIAISRDEAFCFCYPANIQCLKRLGATVEFFSPLHDEILPDADAYWFVGGYPELYAAKLSANHQMLSAIKAVAENKPIYAECGGLLYLCSTLTTVTQQSYPLVGVFNLQALMHQKMQNLGLFEFSLQGLSLRGHSFHYSTVIGQQHTLGYATCKHGRYDELIYQQGQTVGSYMHAYFDSNARLTAHLFSGGAG